MKHLLPAGLFSILCLSGAANAAPPAQFISEAIKGDNSEMRLGKLAQAQGASQGVRQFGLTLAIDHAEARMQAVPVAHQLGITPPDEMVPEAQKEFAKLQGMSGAAFDRECVDHMVKDHWKDIGKFEEQALNGASATAGLARKTLPTLRKHLRIAQGLQR